MVLLGALEGPCSAKRACPHAHVCCCSRAHTTGASPLFFSQAAVDKLTKRKTKPATYNLDMNLIGERLVYYALSLPCSLLLAVLGC